LIHVFNKFFNLFFIFFLGLKLSSKQNYLFLLMIHYNSFFILRLIYKKIDVL
jgi:hypothetical protein